MKNEHHFEELKKEIKKLQNRMDAKSILFLILGIVGVTLIIVGLILRLKDRRLLKNNFYGDYEDYFIDDEDDFNNEYYDNFNEVE